MFFCGVANAPQKFQPPASGRHSPQRYTVRLAVATAHDGVEGRCVPADRDDVAPPQRAETLGEPAFDKRAQLAHDAIPFREEGCGSHAVSRIARNRSLEADQRVVYQAARGHAARPKCTGNRRALRALGDDGKPVRCY